MVTSLCSDDRGIGRTMDDILAAVAYGPFPMVLISMEAMVLAYVALVLHGRAFM